MLSDSESEEPNSSSVSVEVAEFVEAMLSDSESEEPNSSSVPVEVAEFVESLVTKAEEIELENNALKIQIMEAKRKLEEEKEAENINRKQKVELMKLFRQMLEERANKDCKSCKSLESRLNQVKRYISDLLKDQTKATDAVFEIHEKIKDNKNEEEERINDIKEFINKIEVTKKDHTRHFRHAKFIADLVQYEVKSTLKSEASEEFVAAVEVAAVKNVMNQAFDEIPAKIAAFEKESISEAMEKLNEEFAMYDETVPKEKREEIEVQFNLNISEDTKDVLREIYMKRLF